MINKDTDVSFKCNDFMWRWFNSDEITEHEMIIDGIYSNRGSKIRYWKQLIPCLNCQRKHENDLTVTSLPIALLPEHQRMNCNCELRLKTDDYLNYLHTNGDSYAGYYMYISTNSIGRCHNEIRKTATSLPKNSYLRKKHIGTGKKST